MQFIRPFREVRGINGQIAFPLAQRGIDFMLTP